MSTKIDWSDETINPLGWGCYGPGGTPDAPNVCSYCYAKRMAHRGVRDCDLCRQFIPHWHPEHIEKALTWQKPRKIFWQSMGDLFHPCTPWEKIKEVLTAVQLMPQHIHIFLTKNPKRLKDFNPWPSNCWVGTTVTNQADADERLFFLMDVDASVLFVSIEPLLGPVDLTRVVYPPLRSTHKHHPYIAYDVLRGHMIGPDDVGLPKLSWGIVGSMTGPGAVKPEPEWVQGLVEQYKAVGVPIFLKDNLGILGLKGTQDFPA